MVKQQIQGWSLIAGAAISMIVSTYAFFANDLDSAPILVLSIAGNILLIWGVFAIQSFQPQIGFWGKCALVLICLELVSYTGMTILQLENSSGMTLHALLVVGLNSLILNYLELPIAASYILVGWLTSRAQVFPAWAGWFLMVSGFLRIASSLYVSFAPLNLGQDSVSMLFYLLLPLLNVVAWAGYGLEIIKKARYPKGGFA